MAFQPEVGSWLWAAGPIDDQDRRLLVRLSRSATGVEALHGDWQGYADGRLTPGDPESFYPAWIVETHPKQRLLAVSFSPRGRARLDLVRKEAILTNLQTLDSFLKAPSLVPVTGRSTDPILAAEATAELLDDAYSRSSGDWFSLTTGFGVPPRQRVKQARGALRELAAALRAGNAGRIDAALSTLALIRVGAMLRSFADQIVEGGPRLARPPGALATLRGQETVPGPTVTLARPRKVPRRRLGSTASALDRSKDQFAAEHPDGAFLVSLFSRDGGVVRNVSPARKGGGEADDWTLSVRLPGDLSETYHLTGDILVWCTAAPRLNSTLPPLIRLQLNGDAGLYPELAIIITSDPQADATVRQWATSLTTDLAIVPLSAARLRAIVDIGKRSPLQEISDALAEWFSSRNLYRQGMPVSGGGFFGRRQDIRSLQATVQQGQHAGVFGLRRVGKTSVLWRLSEHLQQSHAYAVVSLDLQSAPELRPGAWAARQIAQKALAAMAGGSLASIAQRFLGDAPSWRDSPDEISRVIAALNSVLEATKGDDLRLVVLLDEIDLLTSSPSEEVRSEAAVLFRGLRAISQQSGRLVIVVAGVNDRACAGAKLGIHDNPLLGFFVSNILGPLSLRDSKEMISTVGKRMRLTWQGEAAESLVREVGGHPYLANLAAAELAQRYDKRPLTVTLAMVQEVIGEFHDTFRNQLEGILGSLREYYPDELDLLEWLAQEETELAREYGRQHRDVALRLNEWGLVSKDLSVIQIPVLERWLHFYGAPR